MPSRLVENVGTSSRRILQRTQEKLDDLSNTVGIAKEKLYKDLCSELEKDEELENPREIYESLYGDLVNRWIEEIHNIEVNIMQLTEWIENEASNKFNELYNKRQRTLTEAWNELNNKSAHNNHRMFSAKAPNYPVKELSLHESVIGRPTRINTTESDNRDIDRDLLTVKLNRTMKLRKAENQRRQKANEGELFSFSTKCAARKKLDQYKLKYVYNRLHETPTFASNCQRKARKSARGGHRLFQQPSITTVKTLPLSRTQTPVKAANAWFDSGKPDKPPQNNTCNADSAKVFFLPPLKDKIALVSQGSSQGRLQNDKSAVADAPSRLPRPRILGRKKKKGDNTSGANKTTRMDKAPVVESRKLDHTKSLNQIEDRSDRVVCNNLEQMSSSSMSSCQSGKKTGKFHWKKLLKKFPTRDVKNTNVKSKLDDFSDIKSSFVDAQKIYGHPKSKGRLKKKEKQDQKREKVEKVEESCQNESRKQNKGYKPMKFPKVTINETFSQTPLNGVVSEQATGKTEKRENVANVKQKKTEGTQSSFFTRPSRYKKKPKSAVTNAQSKKKVEKSSLEDTEKRNPSGASIKVEPRKSKSDNSLETNKEASEIKAKNKPKPDSKPKVQIPEKGQVSNKKQDVKEEDMGLAKFIMKPPRQTRQKTKKKANQVRQPYATTANHSKLEVQNGGKSSDKEVYHKNTMNTGGVVLPSKEAPKSRNKPKSTIVRNAFAESEEWNLGPSTDYVFTKFSDQKADKDKLAKLDEKFKLRKARVESTVIRNQRNNTAEDDETVISQAVDFSNSEVFLTKEQSSGSVHLLLSDFNGTALLKRRIDQLKEDLIRRTLESDLLTPDVTATSSSPNPEDPDSDKETQVKDDSDFWQMSDIPKFFQNRAIVHRAS